MYTIWKTKKTTKYQLLEHIKTTQRNLKSQAGYMQKVYNLQSTTIPPNENRKLTTSSIPLYLPLN